MKTVDARASTLAVLAHHNVFNTKSGEPYIMHPMRVAQRVRRVFVLAERHGLIETSSPSEWARTLSLLRAICWLHDTVEDTWVTEEILEQVVGEHEVVMAVVALSKREGQSEDEYLHEVSSSPLALIAKISDMADNSDPKRLEQLTPVDADRLRRKYLRYADKMGVSWFFSEVMRDLAQRDEALT